MAQKFVELFITFSVVIPAQAGIQGPGFRVALPIASFPGMTFELYRWLTTGDEVCS
jgi:hypothetical protein